MYYRDNARKFEEVYEKLWKPNGNKYDKQSDSVKILTNTDGSKSIEFLSEPADGQLGSIEFNQSMKIITKISYMTI